MNIEHARLTRAKRSSLLMALAGGELSLRSVLNDCPADLLEVEVYDVCLAARGLGRSGARQVFERAGVWPHLRMSELSRADLAAIARQLPTRIA